MKQFLFSLALLLTAFLGQAQIKDAATKKTDSVAQKVIYYLQKNLPDSVYALTASTFQDKITAENFTAIVNDQLLPMNDFKTVQFVSSAEGINKYKVEGSPTLQLLIGLDLLNKVSTLLIQPYVE